jgi:hypothetical protein
MTEDAPSTRLMWLTMGYQVSQAIHVAATIGIADLLRGGPRHSADLAIATGMHPPSLYRLLRALATVEVFREHPIGQFALTPMGECLCSDSADPVGPWAVLSGRPAMWQAWAHLRHTVQTGGNAFRHVHGVDPWEFRSQRPEEQVVFDQAMTAHSHRTSAEIVAAFDFGRFRRIVDVGGGHGHLLTSILAACGGTRGVLFDQPQVVAGAGDLLSEAGVADRCEIIGGDFLKSIPDGGDAYILKSVIHNWADTEASAILRTCRRAIVPDGRVLIIERLVAPPNEGAFAKFFDLHMLIALGAQERTGEEFTTLLDAAGFDLVAIHPAGIGLSVIEGVPR